jgi:hypothetical protein
MIYNKQKHIQLLKRSQDFKNQGKSFYKESTEEYLELSHYDIAVEHHILWQQRYKVYELMQDFLNRKIHGEEFSSGVFGFRRNFMNASEQFLVQLGAGEVKYFQPDSRSKNLSGFLSGLFCECDHFMEDYQNPQFYTCIQNRFLNFQKTLNEE